MLTDPTKVAELVAQADRLGHATRFEGGVLRCRCGWMTNRVFFSAGDVEAAGQRHLQEAVDRA